MVIAYANTILANGASPGTLRAGQRVSVQFQTNATFFGKVMKLLRICDEG